VDALTELALAARDGDRQALEELVRATQVDMWRLCAHLGDREDADDLTQETYVRAMRSLPTFRGESAVRTWLFTIARRVCADHVRSVVRQRALQERAERQRPPIGVGPVEFSDVWIQVEGLREEYRSALVLTQVVGLSYEEAAEVCDCPVGTIRSRVSRARAEIMDEAGAP
jgi:RNA polymerase sigma-70 factor (ECF subfamily)